jgi:hypothetical protein
VANILIAVERQVKVNIGDPDALAHALDGFASYTYWEEQNAEAANAASAAGANASKGSAAPASAAPASAAGANTNTGSATAAAPPAAPPTAAAAKASAAQGRTDQQTTASSGAAGSTSTTSKGSVPWLLGLAEEYGGLTQSVSGSTTSVNGNVANIIKAINKKDYEQSFNAWPENPISEAMENASFSMAFNTGSSSSSTQSSINASSFSSATAHIDMYNKRDPRNGKWTSAWEEVVKDQGASLADAAGKYGNMLNARSISNLSTADSDAIIGWRQNASTKLGALVTYLSSTKDSQTDQDTRTTTDLTAIWSDFNSKVCSLNTKYPDLKAADAKAQAALMDYTTKKNGIISEINKSPVFSFEYTFTNQSSVALPKSTTQTYAIGTAAPDLSNFNLIFQAPLSPKGSNQIIVNASTTLFTAPSAQLHLSPVRDFKVSAEADFSLPSFVQLAKSTLSISGLVQDLLQEPLGQQVTVNGVSVTNTGTIVLGQVKWTFPAGTSGITFPVSFTASNRTDLIKETTAKGTVGISYNLDNLLAQTAK